MNFIATTPPLEELCLDVCCKWFSKLPNISKEKLPLVHSYLNFASPLLEKIAHRSHYHFSGNQTLLFIPFLFKKGKLTLTDQNISEVAMWLNSFNITEEGQAVVLKKLIVNAPNAENYFKLFPFIAKVPSIKWLELSSWTTDDVLASIGRHCTQIEILDARGDGETVITDVGLGFISHCKTLKMVLFSDIADEYDYEDKFKFTGKGIALLMLSLPKLERIECTEYLLRDALEYIYQMNFQNPALPIKCLFLAYPNIPARTVSLLPYLCPHLHTLSVYVPYGNTSFLSSSIKRLLCLKKLKLKAEVCCNLLADNLIEWKSPIEYLIIDTQYLHEDVIYKLNLIFTHLKTLVLIVHGYGFVPKSDSILNCKYFSNLHTIQFDQRISGKLFKLLNLNLVHIKAVYCQQAEIYNVKNVLSYIISKGGWEELEILVLPRSFLFTSNFLFDSLTKLSRLQFLAVKFTSNDEERIFTYLIRQSSSNIKLCATKDLPRPSKDFSSI